MKEKDYIEMCQLYEKIIAEYENLIKAMKEKIKVLEADPNYIEIKICDN